MYFIINLNNFIIKHTALYNNKQTFNKPKDEVNSKEDLIMVHWKHLTFSIFFRG